MARLSNSMRLLALPLAVSLAGCAAQASHWERAGDDVIVRPTAGGAAAVRLQVVSDGIIRVTADPAARFERSQSLMRVDAPAPAPAFEVTEGQGKLRVTARGISAEVGLADGRVAFFDVDGKPLLAEVAGGRSFEPVEFDGRPYASIRQRFESSADEGLYGTGLHQQGWMDLKGRDVELLQHNIDNGIPYLVSSRGYGILWDNNSITRYGDPRGLRQIGEVVALYDKDGVEGALTATYSIDGEVKLVRREEKIDYQFIAGLEDFPEEGKNLAPGGRSEVVWEGRIAARSDGRHTFSLFNSEYAKLYVDGKLVIDRWRQNWNPWHHEFALELKAGEPHDIRIEWDRIEPAYLALQGRDPLPPAEAQDLSIWSEAAQVIDYYAVAGSDIAGAIAGYRQLTGKAVLLPKWSYGFWQSRERYKTQAELTAVLDEYRRRKLPIDAIVLDWSYWPEDAWGSHDFDPGTFPDPEGMVQHVHDRNAQIMISVWPKFYPTTAHYRELDAAGAMFTRNVEVGERDWIGEGYLNSFYDAHSAKGREIFWRQMHDKLDTKGFDAWWLDASEPDLHSNLDTGERKARTMPNALGSSVEYFNSYPLVHSEGVYQGSRKANPDKRVFILSRAYFAGQQRAGAAFWSGDIVPRWDDYREQISGLVNASMAGAPNVSFDIGGFSPERRYETKDPAHLPEWRELSLRWFQHGAFVPVFRLHGQFPYREIWEIAPEGTPHYDSFVHYLKLRYTLLPYIYTLAGDTWHRDGTILRALAMDFPSDAKARDIADQYLFGPAFLVAPVTQFRATSREVYLPAGASWIDFETGQRHEGGQTVTAAAPLQRMPLFVRAGSIVPRTVVQQYVDEQPGAPLTIEVYTGADGSFSLYEDNGRSYGYERGESARIPLAWDEQRGELSIGAREGAYPGMAASREIRVRFVDGPRGDNGALEPAADVTVTYDGGALTVRRPKA
ncbi:glycoside hydrolase family 31 protein [Luteimonas composti]|uniref:Glycoside hydrolase family 31 protein n=1 Tax=Luteimonas composti TaxID=398257 RepID=A0ABT6MT52_9GAMM|nr:TIM-barrel domain-containing protein [Luteimonas composti]MDH7453814.1 glycoside hydrolase family 31 protein [Luteimonas composti]